MNIKQKFYTSIVDSSLSEEAIANVRKVDTEMLVHMNNLHDRVQEDLTKFQPVIVAQFTPGGGKFTLLQNKYNKESRTTIEPVSNLFEIAKSIAHAPLGIYGCFGPYTGNLMNQDWREPLEKYLNVLQASFDTFDNIGEGLEIDDTLKESLTTNLNKIPEKFDEACLHLTSKTVISHIKFILKKLLTSAIHFITNTALPLKKGESIANVFQEWCNEESADTNAPNNTLYKLIVQCQVIAATTQEYGISKLMEEWKNTFSNEEWSKLYVIVEAEWVTRKLNSIAQSILPHMTDKLLALNQKLLIVTNLSDVKSALHFLARIIEDRAAANLILTNQKGPRKHLSGQVDLLGPIMFNVVCGNMLEEKKEEINLVQKCPY